MAGLRHVLQNTNHTRDMPMTVMRGLSQSVPYLGVYLGTGVMQGTAVDISRLSVAGGGGGVRRLVHLKLHWGYSHYWDGAGV